jgi:hypothetical protein
MVASELRSENWLLAYEANFKAWLPNQGGVDFVALDPDFSFLKNQGVYFYDQNAKRHSIWGTYASHHCSGYSIHVNARSRLSSKRSMPLLMGRRTGTSHLKQP